ncbi:MAG: AhpC/TSA family protein [Prevotellaceae bacterium]|nr:AhpC/TSA family protein [Prevotellaceae bacterium]
MGVKSGILTIIKSIIFCLILSSCAGGDTSRINGNAETLGGKTVYLERIEPIHTRLLDSAKVKSNGDFSFKIAVSSEPYFLTLRTDSLLLGMLLVDKNESINFRYNSRQYEVEGSEGSVLLKKLNGMVSRNALTRDSILQKLEPDNANLTEVNRQLVRLLTKQKQDYIRFVVTNPKSFASIMAMYQEFSPGLPIFGRAEDFPYYRLLIDSLQTKYMGSAYIEQLKTDSKNLKQQIELQARLDNLVTEASFPEISLPDKSGKEVKLSSLKGKVILLYFWSTTMEGNQLDNRELLNLYEKYHSKGLEIYQVSLDTDRTRWIKAIETQELPWINVCDGKGTSSPVALTYNIQALPNNFIFSKDEDLAAKNLFGDALDKKIAELLR